MRTCERCSVVFRPKSPRRSRRFCSVSCAVMSRPPTHRTNSGGFKKGQVPWNKGLVGFRARKPRPGTGEAIRRGMLTNGKPRISPENERARKSTEYKAWRLAVFTRDNYTCQLCGAKSKAGLRVVLNADHIVPFAVNPELRTDVGNGRTLCDDCHRKTPTYGAGAMKFTGKKAFKEQEPQ